jgi:hypothetical protein
MSDKVYYLQDAAKMENVTCHDLQITITNIESLIDQLTNLTNSLIIKRGTSSIKNIANR